jgi:hypothetical protein
MNNGLVGKLNGIKFSLRTRLMCFISVSDNIIAGIASSVFKDDYGAILRRALRAQIKHPYYFGLYTSLFELLNWKVISTRLTLPNPIRLLFDRKKGYEGFASAIYYEVLSQFEAFGWNVNLGDMGFGSKRIDIPLQAADLFVGAVGRHYLRSRRRNTSPQDNLEKSLLALGQSKRLAVANAGPPELKAFAAAMGYKI